MRPSPIVPVTTTSGEPSDGTIPTRVPGATLISRGYFPNWCQIGPFRFNRLRRFSQLTQPPCPGGSTLIAAPRSGRGGRRFKSCHSDQHLAENSTRRATDYATASWDEERIPRNRNRPISAHTLRGPFRLSHGPVCRIFTRAAVRPRTGARCFFSPRRRASSVGGTSRGVRGMVRFLRRRGRGQGKALTLGGVAETFVALNRGPRVQAMED